MPKKRDLALTALLFAADAPLTTTTPQPENPPYVLTEIPSSRPQALTSDQMEISSSGLCCVGEVDPGSCNAIPPCSDTR